MANKSSSELNTFERICVNLLYAGCWLFSRIPHVILYWVIAPVVRFIFYRVVKYRLRVVRRNIVDSFPEKSESEIRSIIGEFYTVLAEAIVGTLCLPNRGAGLELFSTIDTLVEGSAADLKRRLAGGSWVGLSAHFGTWEYLSVWAHYSQQKILAVYHPLENKIFEALFRKFRNCSVVKSVPAKESVLLVIKNGHQYQGKSYSLGLIADQNPPLLPDSTWFNFLGRETIFFEGGEKLARRAKLPVYFVYQRRTGRGRYEFWYRPIWDGVEELPPAEITRRYVEMLEAEIRKTPSMWLWSHKRWKHKRNNQ